MLAVQFQCKEIASAAKIAHILPTFSWYCAQTTPHRESVLPHLIAFQFATNQIRKGVHVHGYNQISLGIVKRSNLPLCVVCIVLRNVSTSSKFVYCPHTPP